MTKRQDERQAESLNLKTSLKHPAEGIHDLNADHHKVGQTKTDQHEERVNPDFRRDLPGFSLEFSQHLKIHSAVVAPENSHLSAHRIGKHGGVKPCIKPYQRRLVTGQAQIHIHVSHAGTVLALCPDKKVTFPCRNISKKVEKTVAINFCLCYDIQVRLQQICVEAGGCGALRRLFPWSMSDFTPGEQYYEQTARYVLCTAGCPDIFEPTPGFSVREENPVFSCRVKKHPAACLVLKMSPANYNKEAIQSGSQRENQDQNQGV